MEWERKEGGREGRSKKANKIFEINKISKYLSFSNFAYVTIPVLSAQRIKIVVFGDFLEKFSSIRRVTPRAKW